MEDHRGPTIIGYFKTEHFQVVYKLRGQTIFGLLLIHFRAQKGSSSTLESSEQEHLFGKQAYLTLCLQLPLEFWLKPILSPTIHVFGG